MEAGKFRPGPARPGQLRHRQNDIIKGRHQLEPHRQEQDVRVIEAKGSWGRVGEPPKLTTCEEGGGGEPRKLTT